MIAGMMRAMQAVGCTPEQIVAAVVAWDEDRKAKGREASRRRQQAWRERNANNANNAHNALPRYAPLSPPKEIPHTPLENNPPIPPSPVTSREVTSPTEKIEKIEKISLDRETISAEAKAKLRSLGEQWNAFAGELRLPQIEEIRPGSARERAALARIRDGTDFTRIFAKIRGSPFLRGEKGGSSPAAFDWIINPTNTQKILEGNYDEIRRLPTRAYA